MICNKSDKVLKVVVIVIVVALCKYLEVHRTPRDFLYSKNREDYRVLDGPSLRTRSDGIYETCIDFLHVSKNE